MIDKHLHLRRRKDGIEVITLEQENLTPNSRYGKAMRRRVPVRYVASGRKGYLKADDIENDFVVIGTRVDIDARWSQHVRNQSGPSAAALEEIRERDLRETRKRILENTRHPQPGDNRQLKQLNPSPNAISALDNAIHMILAGL